MNKRLLDEIDEESDWSSDDEEVGEQGDCVPGAVRAAVPPASGSASTVASVAAAKRLRSGQRSGQGLEDFQTTLSTFDAYLTRWHRAKETKARANQKLETAGLQKRILGERFEGLNRDWVQALKQLALARETLMHVQAEDAAAGEAYREAQEAFLLAEGNHRKASADFSRACLKLDATYHTWCFTASDEEINAAYERVAPDAVFVLVNGRVSVRGSGLDPTKTYADEAHAKRHLVRAWFVQRAGSDASEELVQADGSTSLYRVLGLVNPDG